MKLFLKICLTFGILTNFSYTQVNWNLDYNSANFAFLVVDYTTYNFEGGYFTKFDYHTGYDNNEIPFSIIYTPPLDLGGIAFTYSATDDTIFAATIVWAGQGHITFPDSITGSNEFEYDLLQNVLPDSIQYYKYVDELEDSIFYRKADSAWLAVKKLSVLKKFGQAGNIFRVGIYLYAPTVGMFNPYVAKWIIFLYRGQLIMSVNEKSTLRDYHLFQNYPNPFNPTTKIGFRIANFGFVSLKVFDVLGREVKTLVNETRKPGTYEVQFSAEGGSASGGEGSNLSSGIYFYRLHSGNFIQTRKMLLLR